MFFLKKFVGSYKFNKIIEGWLEPSFYYNLTKPISMKKINCLFTKSYNTNVRQIIVKNTQTTLINVKNYQILIFVFK